jgi:hypothetical protein
MLSKMGKKNHFEGWCNGYSGEAETGGSRTVWEKSYQDSISNNKRGWWHTPVIPAMQEV